jgi:hypothetical protein
MATRQEDLYAEDYYAWTQDQAEALRRLAEARWNGPLDLAHLAEEVEDLGTEVRNAVRSHLRRIIEHCLKLEHATATEPRPGWMRTIANARAEIADRLTPTIRRDAEAMLPRLYTQARRVAALGLVEHGEPGAADALPEACPYSVEQFLNEEWLPESGQESADHV